MRSTYIGQGCMALDRRSIIIIIIIILFPFVHRVSVSNVSIFLQRMQYQFCPKGGHGQEHSVRPANW